MQRILSALAETCTHVMEGVHALRLELASPKCSTDSWRRVGASSRGKSSSLLQPSQALDERCILVKLMHAREVISSFSHQVGLELGTTLRAGLWCGSNHPLVERLHVVSVVEPWYG